jgi:hypothetical protein
MSAEVRNFPTPHKDCCAEIYLQDMDMALDNIVPETLDWQHTDEGPE